MNILELVPRDWVVFVEFTGTPGTRLVAYLGLACVGGAFVTVGTLAPSAYPAARRVPRAADGGCSVLSVEVTSCPSP